MASPPVWGSSPTHASAALTPGSSPHDSRPSTSHGGLSSAASTHQLAHGIVPTAGAISHLGPAASIALPSNLTPAVMLSDAVTAEDLPDFDALSMDPAAPSMPSLISSQVSPSLPSDDEHDSHTANEDFLNSHDNDRFLSITAFYNRFLQNKDALGRLEDLPVPPVTTREDLRGDERDMQGINWALRKTTRSAVRNKRVALETSRMSPQVKAVRGGLESTPDTESFFAFKRNDATRQAAVPHFQLRNLMAAPSRSNIFYADRDVVMRADCHGSPAEVAMDLTKEFTDLEKFSITTLAASEDVLIVGGFEGEYAMKGLAGSSDKHTVGRFADRARDSKTFITNHIHLAPSRTSYTPQAVISYNDHRLRILDCTTNTFTHSFGYSKAVNCSATSPNGRMRVVVGDFCDTYITNAETGQPFEVLKTHTDGAFACDWADDGIHVATAAQDSTIVIWDARNWSQPLQVLQSELSIPRCLRFSPVGGGPRVLVSAEADDYLTIFNAQTFASKQVFDYFGRTAGISMTPDGSSLFLANSEPHFGGIMEFERCGWGEARAANNGNHKCVVDWDSDSGLSEDERNVVGRAERGRRGVDLRGLTL